MKKLLTIIFILQISLSLFAQDAYFEKNMSFYSPKILSMGNTNIAQAEGIESFEYNPAGIAGDSVFTAFNFNFNLISNLFQLNHDLVNTYNDANGTSNTSIDLFDIGFYFDPANLQKVIGALLAQASTPYGNNEYANGLGFASSISLGYTGGGFGVGLLVSLDTEVFGERLDSTELDNVITTALLLGYGMSIDLDIIGLDVGVGVRPMYKVRATSTLTPILAGLLEDTESDSDFIKDLSYMTGIGLGFDVGVKAYFFGLSAGIALIDLFGTNYIYTTNTFDNIVTGSFLGTEIVEDSYSTPTTLKIGISYNPELGEISEYINPTVSIDYNVLFIDEGTVEDYAVSSSFWNSLSLGASVEIYEIVHIRAGLNQGYVTAGLGLELSIIDINLGIYSKELGEDVGDRQQMGAALEIGVRL